MDFVAIKNSHKMAKCSSKQSKIQGNSWNIISLISNGGYKILYEANHCILTFTDCKLVWSSRFIADIIWMYICHIYTLSRTWDTLLRLLVATVFWGSLLLAAREKVPEEETGRDTVRWGTWGLGGRGVVPVALLGRGWLESAGPESWLWGRGSVAESGEWLMVGSLEGEDPWLLAEPWEGEAPGALAELPLNTLASVPRPENVTKIFLSVWHTRPLSLLIDITSLLVDPLRAEVEVESESDPIWLSATSWTLSNVEEGSDSQDWSASCCPSPAIPASMSVSTVPAMGHKGTWIVTGLREAWGV